MSSSGLSHRAASRNWLRRGAAVALAALLAACGGGDPLVEFRAQRVLAFGDETSVIQSDGRKHTVNAVNATTGAIDCAENPIWIQIVANSFGLVFPQCNPGNVAAPASRILAAPGARVADVTRQINTHLASGTFGSRDLVTILAGRHDVIDAYRRYPTVSRGQVEAEARAAGVALGVQVNRIAAAGGKVLLGKVLDLGQTPFGLAEKAANRDIDRAALLSALAAQFNAGLRVTIVNDGRQIGLVQTDERIQTVVAFPGNFGFSNVTQEACQPTALPPSCTNQTLVTGAAAGTWLWADSLNLSPGGHFRIGEVAASVANNNPF